MTDMMVAGTCDPAFEGVRDAFAANFDSGLELGAALSVSVEGRNVVDVWGGWTDRARTRPWTRDTLVCVFSCTKGIVALATLILVDRGVLDLDTEVARWWPEFARHGKGDIPLRWLLTHEAGLAAVDRRLPFGSLSEWDTMVEALADTAPNWEPGTGHGYHGVTFGHLVGEVVRRATGRTCGQVIADALAGPLGVDLWMPLDAADDARTADLVVELSPEGTFFSHWDPGRSLGPRAFGNPPDSNDPEHCLTPAFRRAEIPAANLHGTARALDRAYAVMAGGGTLGGRRYLSADLVAEGGRRHVTGPDLVMELPTAFGLGFEHTIPEWPFGPNPHTYGHNGSGGSLGLHDPDTGVTLGYVMNRLWWGPSRSDPRWDPLFDALYAAL